MNYRCWFLFFLLCCSTTFKSFAQSDSCRLQISLLTCGPGEDLYSIFGHTAIRVVDKVSGTDTVYNYGTFDDSDPYFYFKFTKGIMLYSLSVEPFSYFMEEYREEHRAVTQQLLDLSCADKTKLLAALQSNAIEQNRYYNYHFYNDNCTLRARDIIKNQSSKPVSFKNILPDKHPTYRQLIDGYLNASNKYWEKFGIDILLGSHLDAQVTNEQAMFLPDYLMMGFDSAVKDGQQLVKYKQEIIPANKITGNKTSWFTPTSFFTFLLLIALLFAFIKAPWSATALNIFDFIFFLFLGLLGILMLYLWLARVDTVCRNNINILWAIPTHSIIVFFFRKQKRWVKNYFFFTAVISALLLLGWKLWPQELSSAALPICLLIIFRSISIFLKNR